MTFYWQFKITLNKLIFYFDSAKHESAKLSKVMIDYDDNLAAVTAETTVAPDDGL